MNKALLHWLKCNKETPNTTRLSKRTWAHFSNTYHYRYNPKEEKCSFVAKVQNIPVYKKNRAEK